MTGQTPKTVLYVSWAPFFSGAERALLVLTENLDRRRYRPVVIVGNDADLAAELRSRGIETVHIRIVYSGVRQLIPWSTAVARFVSTIRSQGAALVHSNDVPSYQPAGYAAKILGIPTVTHVRFPDSRPGFDWFLKPGFQRALFVSENLRQDAANQAPHLFDNRSEVVYDGVLTPPLVDDTVKCSLRAELGLPLDRPIVALTGQVAEVKGIWDFIDAAEALGRRDAGIIFAVLGDDLRNNGALRRQAEQAVAERGLSETVRFLGFRPNAQRLIPAFDVIAVPSHVEPLGNATLEAMASGRPVVGSRVGGIPEMIVDGVTGALVAPHNPAALADAIASLVRDPDKARAFGRAGRARVIDKFSIEAHVRHVQAIYDATLGQPMNSGA